MSSVSPSLLLKQVIASTRRCSRDPSNALRSWFSHAPSAPTISCSASHLRRPATPHIPSRSAHTHYSFTSTRRTFVSNSSTRAAVAQRPSSHRTQLVSYPSPSESRDEDEDEDDPDVDFVPQEEAVLEMTDRAAEQLRSIAKRENNNAALRIAVESGGCHGYQYKMMLANKCELDDYHFVHPQIQPSNIYVDAVSMTLLKGSIIDFATELIGSSFRVAENPQAKGGGCGCGVSWELKL